MKLHVKLIICILGAIIITNIIAQALQYKEAINIVSELTATNQGLLEKQELTSVNNIQMSIEQSVASSLERGEMEKFARLIDRQKAVKGLLEFSLFNKNGLVTHSTDSSFIGKRMPQEVMEKVSSSFEPISFSSSEAYETYLPKRATSDCLRCHTSWKEGENGGTTYFRFSNEALNNAKAQGQKTLESMRTHSLVNSIISIVAIVAILSALIVVLIKKFVGDPLENFVEALKANTGDLTRRIEIKSSDEIGQIASLFNSFILDLNRAVGIAKGAAVTVLTGTSSWAAAIENISASVEELSATTRLTSDNADQARKLMQSVSEKMEQAGQAMTSLNATMGDLSKSSNETAAIVKTIDEIAFKTNLLALNAAVEAARAGDAGLGFAVVAEEVRNLAKHSTQAAKTTATLIDDTVKKISESSSLLGSTNKAFGLALEESGKASHIVQDIAVASSEQARGIESISDTMTEMDSNTRQNVESVSELERTMSAFKTSA